MAYQVQRKNRIKESLELLNNDGSIYKVLTVDLNVDQIANRVNKAYEEIGRLQLELQKDPHNPHNQEAYGKAVICTLEIIFGEEQLKDILAFYEDSYTEMLLDLFPFIHDCVMPQIREASAKRKEQLMAAAQASMVSQSGSGWLPDILRRRKK